MASRVRVGLIASVVVSGLAALGLVFLPGDRVSDDAASPAATALALDGPDQVDAGAPWTIEVDGVPEGAATVDVSVIGPWGVRSVSSPDPRIGSVVVPGELTRQSGQLVALVRAGAATGRIEVEVVPGPVVDGAVPLAGPRSIVADEAHRTMVTSFPRDRFGNVVADGTEVTVVARRPDGRRTEVTTEVGGLVAAVRVASGTTAGRTALRVDTEGATGPEVEVLEVPGPPVSVTLVGPEGTLRADGRSLVTVTTEALVDRFGNALLDGAVAVASLDGPGGRGTLRSVIIDGRVELVLEAPPAPGTMSVELVVDGVRSRSLALEFVPDVSALPVVFGREGLEIGPVLTTLGGYAPDGTSVVVRAGRTTVREVLRDGVAVVGPDVLDVGAIGRVEVEVLGVVTEVVVP